MKNLTEQDIRQLCFKRIELIEQLELGTLSKEAFIMENYQLMSPFQKVNYDVTSIDEGVIKYHYFNTMAKKLMIEADGLEFKDPKSCDKLRQTAYDFYLKKDKITLSLLEYVDFKGVEAYFIHMKSRTLDGVIYEIRFNTCEKVVLHSRDRKILYKLKEAGCFSEEPVASVIDVYVNTKAY